ncbi:hypothetical protein [Mycolicibacterium phlei]
MIDALMLLAVTYVTWIYSRLAGRPIRGWQHLRWAAPVTLALTVGWFVVRNLPFEPFTALGV